MECKKNQHFHRKIGNSFVVSKIDSALVRVYLRQYDERSSEDQSYCCSACHFFIDHVANEMGKMALPQRYLSA